MRFILCNHDGAFSHDFLRELASRVPVEGVDVIEGPIFTPPAGVPCTHFSRQNVYFEDYGIDWSTVEPVDQEVLDRLAMAEVLAMPMFERFERYTNKMRRIATLIKMGAFTFADYTPYVSYSERKRQFLHHVRFWLDRIRKTRPTALIHL